MKNYRILYTLILCLLISCDTDQVGSANREKSSFQESNNSASDDKKKSPMGNNRNYTIVITQQASSTVDSTFSEFGLNNEDLNTLKEILSDTEPDPENKSGTDCGVITKQCKWCGKDYEVQEHFTTYKNFVEMCTNPFAQIGLFFVGIFSQNQKIEVAEYVHKFCEKFRNGEKYTCTTDIGASDYCSRKCEYEDKHH